MKATLLLVSGPPASGKTSIGKQLAKDLAVAFISIDGFKEILFDTLGWAGDSWSKRLGKASMTLLYHSMAEHASKQRLAVFEANYKYEIDRTIIQTIAEKYSALRLLKYIVRRRSRRSQRDLRNASEPATATPDTTIFHTLRKVCDPTPLSTHL
jgi:cytidylate kinase